MSDLLQDTVTGELVLVNGDLQLTSGRGEVRQNLVQALRFCYGEWFLDTTGGIPYFQQVLVKAPDLVSIQGIFINAITAVPGVLELLSFEFTFDAPSRELTLTFAVNSTDGIIEINETLEAAA